ncbi:MAG TPA: ferrochelatase [Polyangiaceae bacterium]|nr:ferrochelatase [Polyangiaceae bacterium]
MSHYDSLLFVSFGGPERPEDVMPFLENVTRGRNVPRERLLAVAEHYQHFGGKSPINEQNRALIAALGQDFRAHGIELPIYFGNRNWAPFLPDALKQMQADGRRRALAFITSAYSSYSGCRQYLEDIERARAALPGAPEVHALRRFFNHPAFLDACAARAEAAWSELGSELGARRSDARIVFTAHSIPLSMARSCDYERQLRANGQLIAERLAQSSGGGELAWDLVWQSRSGPPEVPWLEPDILDHLRALHAQRVSGVLIAPIGFLTDHVEVLYDLDEEARQLCAELGMPLRRAATVGTHPRFVEMIRQLVLERLQGAPVLSVGPLPAPPGVCAPGCCPRPERPGPRGRAASGGPPPGAVPQGAPPQGGAAR